MAIFIVKSVYSMKNERTKLYVWTLKPVWNNTPLPKNVKAEGIWSLKYD